MGGVFVASVGVAAAATVSFSAVDDPGSATVAAGPGPTEDQPGSKPSPSAQPTPTETDEPKGTTKQVTDAPTKASKAAVKKSKTALCDADPDSLPAIGFRSENLRWGKVLETIAANRGYAPGAIDGIYTVQTRNAVRKFQSEYGLSQDGDMGGAEWEALWNDLCAPDPVYVPPSEPVYTGPSDVGGGPTDTGGGGGGGGGGLNRID